MAAGERARVRVVAWVERRWAFDEPAGLYPLYLERLRGVPPRLEEKLRDLPREVTTLHDGDAWSIQQHVGHLLDLERLPHVRLDELLAGAEVLTAADMTNRATWEADHDARPLEELLGAFRHAREALLARLEALQPEDFARAARHPRLDQPMRLVDLCRFTADHDDHHLVRIHDLAKLAWGE